MASNHFGGFKKTILKHRIMTVQLLP